MFAGWGLWLLLLLWYSVFKKLPWLPVLFLSDQSRKFFPTENSKAATLKTWSHFSSSPDPCVTCRWFLEVDLGFLHMEK